MSKKNKFIEIGSVKLPYFSSRFFSLVLYLPKETVRFICDDDKHIIDYIFIEHDKDFYIDLEGKKAKKDNHIHLLIRTDIPFYSSTIWNKFRIKVNDLFQNVLVIKPLDLTKDVQYLLHLNEDESKFKYDESELVFNSSYFKKYLVRKLNFIYDDLAQCCIDVSQGATKKELLQRYGALYVKNYTNVMLIGCDLKYDIVNDDIY